MTNLRIEWGNSSVELEPNQSCVIGRGETADFKVEGSHVSRHHLDVTYQDGAWRVDDRSSTGTYLDGERIESATITSPISIRLGPAGSAEVQLVPQESTPVIEIGDSQVAYLMTVAADESSLRLDLGDQHSVFEPGRRVVIGRSKDCDMTTANQLVSGEHCAFQHDGERWVLEDLSSTRGTFIDGLQIDRPTPIEGAFFVGLGDPSAGEPLRVITAGEHKRPTESAHQQARSNDAFASSGQQTERTIKLFLASSEELRDDRDALALYLRQQNDLFRKRGLYVQIVRSENFLDAMSKTRLQDEYNKEIETSDIFVSLFTTKTGRCTEEEFDVAHNAFTTNNKPVIYTFFKDVMVSTGAMDKEALKSLWNFKRKLEELGHFYTTYDNVDGLMLQVKDQLEKLIDAKRI